MSFATDQSIFFIITGEQNVGKSWQFKTALEATSLDTGEELFTPCLYLVAEASTSGTLGRLLMNPAKCVVWRVADCDEALAALNACFPDGGTLTIAEARRKEYEHRCKLAEKDKRPKPAPPAEVPAHVGKMTLRSIAVDTLSTLYKGSGKTAMAIAREEIESGANKRVKTTRTTSNVGALNSAMDQGRFAAMRCDALTDRLNGITQHHAGVLVLVSVHTTTALADEKVSAEGETARYETRVIGCSPDLGATKTQGKDCLVPGWSKAWSNVAAKANVIWHAGAEYPNLRNYDLGAANDAATDPANQAAFYVVTQRGEYRGIGRCMWVKVQGSPGEPMEHFLNLPNIWCDKYPSKNAPVPSPNLGLILSRVVRDINLQAKAMRDAT